MHVSVANLISNIDTALNAGGGVTVAGAVAGQ
jgi:hypothetical protein